MKKSDLAQYLLDLDKNVNEVTEKLVVTLKDMFVANPKGTNLDAEANYAAHCSMVEYAVASRINSLWKKEYNSRKKGLDISVRQVLGTCEGIPGETITLHHSNVLQFTKRQNKDGEALSVTDLLNALARAGVEKAVVDKAYKMALKPKRGNVYYEVTALED